MTAETIVLIEDDPHLRRFVAANLGVEGYRIVQAADGEAGLALVERERPALILVDLMLPGTSGWDVLARLQARGDSTPTAVISAAAGAEDVARARALGARDYLIKPLGAAELVRRVRCLLGGQEER